MNIKKRNKWRRGFKIYRKYFLGFGFIAGIMVLALTIDLVKALSPKPAYAEVLAETTSETQALLTSSSVSVTTNPENLVSSYSLATLQFLSEDINIDVVKNDNDIVALAYESITSEEDSKKDTEKVINSESESELDSESKSESESELDSESKSESESKPESGSKSESNSKSESESESESSIPEYDKNLEYNLAKLIDAEGSILDDYCQQLIAYCFLNRMRSNHWKNTFDGVLNDGRGYHPRTCEYVASSDNIPSEKALKNAKICLENHYADTMPVPYNLVFQAGFKQGTVYYYDEEHGVYFCLADKLEPNE